MKIQALRLNGRTEPMAVDDPAPLFSWEITSPRAGDRQAAYRLTVWQGTVPVWDSGRVETDDTIQQVYAGAALEPHKRYTWQVECWSEAGDHAVSDEAHWRTGYLGKPWTAAWISPDVTGHTQTAPLLRRVFTLNEQPVDAELSVYSPGWFQLFVNGAEADDRQLTPAAAPKERHIYETYIITDQLHPGANALGLWLGDGYNERFCRFGWRYTGPKRAIAELRLTFADGSARQLLTDGEWEYTLDSPLIDNGVYDGEYYDARKEFDWATPAAFPGRFSPVTVLPDAPGVLEPRFTPPIRVVETRPYQNWWRSESRGTVILDFGQNMPGFVRLKLARPAGTVMSFRYSEEIDPVTRELDPYTNRSAKATDVYVFKGEGVEEYQPRFTYHGYRYVEIAGLEGDPTPEMFMAQVLHTDMPFVGDFRCDDPQVNQLYSNIRWGMRGNAASYPTDCPMRDERTPCIMDVVSYCEIASTVWDTSSYWKNFLLNSLGKGGDPCWDGAQLALAWHLYTFYGDRRLLEQVYPTMKAFIEHTMERWPEGISDRYFGDWCAPKDNADGGYECAFSYVKPTATALMYYQTMELSWMAQALGDTAVLPRLRERMAQIAAAYDRTFYDAANGWYDEGEQVAGALPLLFGMVPAEKRAQILQSVLDGIRVRRQGHLDTGIYGTKFMPMLLADEGYADVVLDAFFQPTYPGYGYELSKGATTVWEQWWERGGMSSHNHGMFGGGGTFFIRNLLGLRRVEDGCRRVVIRPCKTDRLHEAEGYIHTVRGEYRIAWKRTDGVRRLSVTVPFGCEAAVQLPDGSEQTVTAGTHAFTYAEA